MDDVINEVDVIEFYIGFKLDGEDMYKNISETFGSRYTMAVQENPFVERFTSNPKMYEKGSGHSLGISVRLQSIHTFIQKSEI